MGFYESLDAETATNCRFLKSLRTSNPEKLVFAHLNINSVRNKFDILSDQTKDNINAFFLFPKQKLIIAFSSEAF